ncbi:Uncharacterized protein TCM_022554 [Theobroma cacao]|uniref:RNase H type-1 domain-containing protein n=1 Tax=Theobroma cacao TaxID=3641 RepID=A0A061ET65_THECC|nr:Uncharacterized protein TCM_022554 [Theobroma cacao]
MDFVEFFVLIEKKKLKHSGNKMVIHSNPSFKEILLSSEGEKIDLEANSDDENESMDEDDTVLAKKDADFESDDEVQVGLIEYEGLPHIYFNCVMYGHTKEVCTKQTVSLASKEYSQESTQGIEAEESIYGPWMIASKRKQRRNEGNVIGKAKTNDKVNQEPDSTMEVDPSSVIQLTTTLDPSRNSMVRRKTSSSFELSRQVAALLEEEATQLMKPEVNTSLVLVSEEPTDGTNAAPMPNSENRLCTWNCHGASDKKFIRVVKDLVKSYAINMLILLEPRISGRLADGTIKQLGFDYSHRVEFVGFSGGIWCLWKENVKLHIIKNHNQCVHMTIEDKPNEFWFFTTVYGNPSPNIRCQLWEELSSFENTVTGPWLLANDFNAFLYSHEKAGGSPRDALWAKILRSKYGMGSSCLPDNIHKPGASTFWIAISQSWPQFKLNIKWALGNGISTRFWTDQWLDDILLVDAAKSIGIEIVDESSVKEYVTAEGELDLDKVVNLIPIEKEYVETLSLIQDVQYSKSMKNLSCTTLEIVPLQPLSGLDFSHRIIKLELCSAYRAELWSILKGLTVAWETGHRRIELQIDNSTAVKVINPTSTVISHNYDLIQVIKRLLMKQWVVKIRHVFREENIVADRMANMGITQEGGFMLFDVPPPEINSFLLHDVADFHLSS